MQKIKSIKLICMRFCCCFFSYFVGDRKKEKKKKAIKIQFIPHKFITIMIEMKQYKKKEKRTQMPETILEKKFKKNELKNIFFAREVPEKI